jgi:predicted nucleic acid-binding protein
LDLDILIWGIQPSNADHVDGRRQRAQAFFRHLGEERIRALLPAIVVGEFLVRIPREDQDRVMGALERSFIIAPFDMQTSAAYANIWRQKEASGEIDLLRERYEATGNELRVDCIILATALSSGAECLYSENPLLQELARRVLDVKPIPTIPEQLELFGPQTEQGEG